MENVVRQIKILRVQEYKQRFPTVQQSGDELAEFYFFRQKLVGEKVTENFESRLIPELKPICVCQKIMNVDEESEECPDCKSHFHPMCMRQHSDRRCFECKKELPKKLIYTHKREEANDNPELKRKHVDDNFETLSPEKHPDDQAAKQAAKDPYSSLFDPNMSAKLTDVVAALKKKNEFQLGTEVSHET